LKKTKAEKDSQNEYVSVVNAIISFQVKMIIEESSQGSLPPATQIITYDERKNVPVRSIDEVSSLQFYHSFQVTTFSVTTYNNIRKFDIHFTTS
jgi:hypothetical protein